MEIDRIKVQKLIDETIGPEYEISRIWDSSKYIFIGWKHKKYDIDDERGHRIGVGPIAYNKTTKEYKLLGSGEIISGEYRKYLFENVVEDEEEFKIPKKDEIKNNIMRRKYVNDEDIFFLIENFKIENTDNKDIQYFQSTNKDIYLSRQTIVNIDCEKAIDYIKEFWHQIGFNYSLISESKIMLSKTPNY